MKFGVNLNMRQAFSLVELSIVLVILGLLTGGILAGQSLIRAAELRSVSAEHARYLAAVHTFRDKYFALPGDFRDATRFWNRQLGTADCVSNSGAGTLATGVCDGNGNGQIALPAAASQSGEMYQFWRHLALAGLVEGTYTGLAGTATVFHMTADNVPRSKLNQGSWGQREFLPGTTPASADLMTGQYGNWMQFGGFNPTFDNLNSVLKPEEAWNIDTKMDDGRPGRGRLVIRYWATCTNAASGNDLDTTYRLDSQALGCVLTFPNFAG